MRTLFLFLDGVGLGANDPDKNPLAAAQMPNLEELLDGSKLIAEAAPFEGERATLVALDACLGVPGFPQSASGQATLVTGWNVPKRIGGHFGPKPNQAIRDLLRAGNLFMSLQQAGKQAALLNAYPPRYFEGIESGRRIYSAIPMAVTNAGIALKTDQDLFAGQALAADFTGKGWREHLGYRHSPLLEPFEAGQLMTSLSSRLDLAFLEFWISDYIGHGQQMEAALAMLAEFDQVLGGLLESWDDQEGVILITSDHGNMEDLSTRKHTRNKVPALVIGSRETREPFLDGLDDLSGVTPAILELAGVM